MLLRKVLLALALTTTSAITMAEPGAPMNIEIKREPHFTAPPKAEVAEKRVYIAFEGSPKMTRVLQEKLKAKGFAVVDKPEDADAKFRVGGMFTISGAGKEDVRGKLGDLLESAVGTDQPSNPDYRHQNVDLLQIGVSAAYTGIASVLSVTDMVRWIGQKTGIAGRFNEMLTGDPRGICFGEACSKYTSTVVMNVTGDSGHWWVMEKAQDSKLVLDLVIADVVESTLEPLYELKNAAQGQQGRGDS